MGCVYRTFAGENSIMKNKQTANSQTHDHTPKYQRSNRGAQGHFGGAAMTHGPGGGIHRHKNY